MAAWARPSDVGTLRSSRPVAGMSREEPVSIGIGELEFEFGANRWKVQFGCSVMQVEVVETHIGIVEAEPMRPR